MSNINATASEEGGGGDATEDGDGQLNGLVM